MEIYKEIKKDLCMLSLIVLLVQVVYYVSPIGKDDTDGAARSGMHLRVDQRTGCQYLEGSHGGITPRMDRFGKQVCVR